MVTELEQLRLKMKSTPFSVVMGEVARHRGVSIDFFSECLYQHDDAEVSLGMETLKDFIESLRLVSSQGDVTDRVASHSYTRWSRFDTVGNRTGFVESFEMHETLLRLTQGRQKLYPGVSMSVQEIVDVFDPFACLKKEGEDFLADRPDNTRPQVKQVSSSSAVDMATKLIDSGVPHVALFYSGVHFFVGNLEAVWMKWPASTVTLSAADLRSIESVVRIRGALALGPSA